MVDIQLPGRTRVSFARVTAKDVPVAARRRAAGRGRRVRAARPVPRRSARSRGTASRSSTSTRSSRPQTRWVLANCGIIDPASIDEYIARGGYAALAKALREHDAGRGLRPGREERPARARRRRLPHRQEVEVRARTQPADQKYLICNADEGDPGAFMDRAVIEGDPHRLLEGMAHRRLRHRRDARPTSTSAPSTRWPSSASSTPSPRPRRTACSGDNILDSGFNLEIMHQDGRRRVRLRRGDRADPQHRGQARHAAAPSAVPGRPRPVRQADGHQQRRDAGQPARDRRRAAPSGSPRIGHGRRARAPRCSPCPARSRRTGLVEVADGHDAAPDRLRHRRRHSRRQGVQGGADRRPVRRLHPRRSTSTSRSTTNRSRPSAP